MSISKKIRFEVFKRDGFVCQYCGKHPPEVTLEIDHIIPQSKNGKDGINNLITSCFDCNRGKSNIELKKLPNSILENYEILKERENQLKEYRKLIDRVEKRVRQDIETINNIFQQYFPDHNLTETFKQSIKRNFLPKLDLLKIQDAMHIAGSRINDPERVTAYFCGICWKNIKGLEAK